MFPTSHFLARRDLFAVTALLCLFSLTSGHVQAKNGFANQPIEAGDSNGDRFIDQRDIQPFVLAVSDMDRYRKRYPYVPYLRVHDLNQDQVVDASDLDEFACLLGEHARNRFLELGPVPGLTQGYHPAPTVTAIPRGSQVPLRVLVYDVQREHRQQVKQVRWEGATGGEDSSLAIADFRKPGLHTIKAWAEWQSGGEELVAFGTYLVEKTVASDVQFEILDISGLPFTVVEGASNRETKAAFFAPESIAEVKFHDGYLCTSTERTLQVDVRSSPGGFAPLAELTVNGTPTGMGTLDTFVCHDPGSIWLRVGSIHHAEPVLMDIYRTLLVEPLPGSPIPLGVPVDYRAITEPAGFEDQIVWLSSTHFGTGTPTLGRGPNFRATFRDARGKGGLAWVGVRCNETILDSDSAPQCEVFFLNTSRCRDRVVSAKDDTRDLPGGEKSLDAVVIAPEGRTATLTIRRIAGNTGSATFKSTNSATRLLTVEDTITIKGGEISDVPRNMIVEATIDGELCGSWRFTVFRIDPELITTGKAETVFNGTERTNAGFGSRTLREEYITVTRRNEGNLGHVHISGEKSYAGIVVRGKVVPSGMDRTDFNLKHSRSQAFNWTLTESVRFYDKKDCHTERLVSTNFAASDDWNADRNDYWEDLLPDADKTPGELFIWFFDVHSSTPSDVLLTGDIFRVRANWKSLATYAGERVSKPLFWYWRSSVENKGPSQDFEQNGKFPDDNKVAEGSTLLTPDFAQSQHPNIIVTHVEPLFVKKGQSNIGAAIQGLNFKAAHPCVPVVYLYGHEVRRDNSTTVLYRRLQIDQLTDNLIKGTFKDVPESAPDGPYVIKIILGGHVQTRLVFVLS